ncbi:MAG: hypothetical protein RLZZ502_1721, partial [Pseudomonadota bacterium]
MKIFPLFLFLYFLSFGVLKAEGVQLNFANAEIEAVVKTVSELTGRTFLLDPKVKGTINMVSAKAVPKSAIYPALLSALR